MTDYSDLVPEAIRPRILAALAAKDIERYAESDYRTTGSDERYWNLRGAAGNLANLLQIVNKPTDRFEKLVACIEVFSDDELSVRGSLVDRLFEIRDAMFPKYPMPARLLPIHEESKRRFAEFQATYIIKTKEPA